MNKRFNYNFPLLLYFAIVTNKKVAKPTTITFYQRLPVTLKSNREQVTMGRILEKGNENIKTN